MQFLVQNNADINKATTDKGLTPLFIACKNSFADIVKFLIDLKSQVNISDMKRLTPLLVTLMHLLISL